MTVNADKSPSRSVVCTNAKRPARKRKEAKSVSVRAGGGDFLGRPEVDHDSERRANCIGGEARLLVSSTPPPQPPAPASEPVKRASSQHQQAGKNYHHYDYYTDSDLAPAQAKQANHFGWAEGENVLLFASEHDGKPANANQRPQAGPNNGRRLPASTPVGRFVNYYPSWRQGQPLPASQNYSFHVPLAAGQRRPATPSPGEGSPRQTSNRLLYQARYGFLAPATEARLAAGPEAGGFRQSFRSRTIGHIPNMLGMSVEEARAAQLAFEAPDQPGSNYEDFYEKSSYTGNDLSKQFVVSEGNLLRASLLPRPACDLRKSIIKLDEGHDNPFRPETELSWEADVMVKLMRRGYPLEELAALVQTAKELALEREKEREPAARRLREARRPAPFRRQASTGELSSRKQLWASSLNRAKSMPRFNSQADDSDSIDKLIASIEAELAQPAREEEKLAGQETADNKPAERPTISKVRKQKTGGQKPTEGQLAPASPAKETVHSTSERGRRAGVKSRPLAKTGNQTAAAGRRKKKRRQACCIIQ